MGAQYHIMTCYGSQWQAAERVVELEAQLAQAHAGAREAVRALSQKTGRGHALRAASYRARKLHAISELAYRSAPHGDNLDSAQPSHVRSLFTTSGMWFRLSCSMRGSMEPNTRIRKRLQSRPDPSVLGQFQSSTLQRTE